MRLPKDHSDRNQRGFAPSSPDPLFLNRRLGFGSRLGSYPINFCVLCVVGSTTVDTMGFLLTIAGSPTPTQ